MLLVHCFARTFFKIWRKSSTHMATVATSAAIHHAFIVDRQEFAPGVVLLGFNAPELVRMTRCLGSLSWSLPPSGESAAVALGIYEASESRASVLFFVVGKRTAELAALREGWRCNLARRSAWQRLGTSPGWTQRSDRCRRRRHRGCSTAGASVGARGCASSFALRRPLPRHCWSIVSTSPAERMRGARFGQRQWQHGPLGLSV